MSKSYKALQKAEAERRGSNESMEMLGIRLPQATPRLLYRDTSA